MKKSALVILAALVAAFALDVATTRANGPVAAQAGTISGVGTLAAALARAIAPNQSVLEGPEGEQGPEGIEGPAGPDTTASETTLSASPSHLTDYGPAAVLRVNNASASTVEGAEKVGIYAHASGNGQVTGAGMNETGRHIRKYGVVGEATGTANVNIGISGFASGGTTKNSIGVYGEAESGAGTIAKGVFGKADDTDGQGWAGYFEGDVFISGQNYLIMGKLPRLDTMPAGAPPAADCDTDEETGRIYYSADTYRLYVCNGAIRGWDSYLFSDN